MTTIMVATDRDIRECVRHRDVAKDVLTLLSSTYPKYKWFCEPNLRGGIVNIRCGEANAMFGYTLHPSRYFSETAWRAAVIKAGGEILERSSLNRRSRDLAEFVNAPRDMRGLIIPDALDIKANPYRAKSCP